MVNEEEKTAENQSLPTDGTAQTDENPNNRLSIIEQAKAEADRAEAAIAALKEENDRKEALLAEEKLSGVGAPKTEATPAEETPKDYMTKVMSGGLNEQASE